MRIGVGVLAFAFPVICGSADLSGVPLSSKRAYGRLIDRPFQLSQAKLKKLGQISAKNRRGAVTDVAQVWALSLEGGGGQGFVLYFTAEIGEEITKLAYRRPPVLRSTPEYRKVMFTFGDQVRSVPIGVTSAQMLFLNPKSGKVESKVYRDMFTARLLLQRGKSDMMGQVLLLMPDQKKSFVYGAFKVAQVQ